MYLGHSSSFWSEDKDLSFADWSAADYVPLMGASCINHRRRCSRYENRNTGKMMLIFIAFVKISFTSIES
jgi:hypothetical protein